MRAEVPSLWQHRAESCAAQSQSHTHCGAAATVQPGEQQRLPLLPWGGGRQVGGSVGTPGRSQWLDDTPTPPSFPEIAGSSCQRPARTAETEQSWCRSWPPPRAIGPGLACLTWGDSQCPHTTRQPATLLPPPALGCETYNMDGAHVVCAVAMPQSTQPRCAAVLHACHLQKSLVWGQHGDTGVAGAP